MSNNVAKVWLPNMEVLCQLCLKGHFHMTHSVPHFAWINGKLRVEWYD
jgi:hypothetical protein